MMNLGNNLEKTINELSVEDQQKQFCFRIKNSKEFFNITAKKLIRNFEWLPEYEKVIDWMENNECKGLILHGSNGRGKTMIAKKIIPVFFKYFFNRYISFYNAQEMNEKLDEILLKKLIILDDIGTEEQKIYFGDKRWAFPEIMDNAEKEFNIVIITTNLTPDLIELKYGLRTRERIRVCCKPVKFFGETLRK